MLIDFVIVKEKYEGKVGRSEGDTNRLKVELLRATIGEQQEEDCICFKIKNGRVHRKGKSYVTVLKE